MSRRSLLEAMQDPEEMPLLSAVLRSPLDPEARRAYTDFLGAQGDPRGKLLDLLIKLEGPTLPPKAEALRGQLRRLVPKVDPFWVRLFSRAAWILNCGAQRDEPARLRFSTECPRLWEEMEPTDTPEIRQCGKCKEAVHACRTREEAEAHAVAGRCIAVPSAIADAVQRDVVGYAKGRPHAPTLWAERLFGQR